MLGEEKPGAHGRGSTASVAGRRWALGLLNLAPSPVRTVAFLPKCKGKREREGGREET